MLGSFVADLRQPQTATAGGAVLSVRDALGVVVYDKGFVPSLNEPTSPGTAGAWTIQRRMTGYSGTVNFRAQSRGRLPEQSVDRVRWTATSCGRGTATTSASTTTC